MKVEDRDVLNAVVTQVRNGNAKVFGDLPEELKKEVGLVLRLGSMEIYPNTDIDVVLDRMERVAGVSGA